MNMWGRSICYRFAATAPLSLWEYDKSGDVNYGWIRRIASSTLLQFLENPKFLEEGVPTMGFMARLLPLCRFIVVGVVYTGAEKLF